MAVKGVDGDKVCSLSGDVQDSLSRWVQEAALLGQHRDRTRNAGAAASCSAASSASIRRE